MQRGARTGGSWSGVRHRTSWTAPVPAAHDPPPTATVRRDQAGSKAIGACELPQVVAPGTEPVPVADLREPALPTSVGNLARLFRGLPISQRSTARSPRWHQRSSTDPVRHRQGLAFDVDATDVEQPVLVLPAPGRDRAGADRAQRRRGGCCGTQYRTPAGSATNPPPTGSPTSCVTVDHGRGQRRSARIVSAASGRLENRRAFP